VNENGTLSAKELAKEERRAKVQARLLKMATEDGVMESGAGPLPPQYQTKFWEEYDRIKTRAEAEAMFAASQASKNTARLRVLSRSELRELPRPTHLIDAWLPEGLVYCCGVSGSGKSFSVIDMMGSVATGRAFHGYTAKQGKVVYVCNEGTAGMDARLTAWEHINDTELDLSIITGAPQLIGNQEWLMDNCKGADLVVIDTQAKSTVGIEENSAKDMGPVMTVYQRLLDAGVKTVLVVHHSGKDGEGLRGSSAMLAAADAVIAVSRDGDAGVVLTMAASRGGKVKDGETPPDLRLVKRPDPMPVKQGEYSSVALVTDAAAMTGAELAVLRAVCTNVDDNHMPDTPITTATVAAVTQTVSKNALYQLDKLHKRFLVDKHGSQGTTVTWTATAEGKQMFTSNGGTLPKVPEMAAAERALMVQLDGNTGV